MDFLKQLFVICAKMPGINMLMKLTPAVNGNCQQRARWQHISQLKASVFSWQKKNGYQKTQQLILWISTAIWWVTESDLMNILHV